MRKGVVWNVESAAWLLSPLFAMPRGLSLVGPSVLACAPTDASAEERESLREALRKAGASRVTLVSEPFAAATGAGLDTTSPAAQLVVEVGEGVTDLAVIRKSRIETSPAVRSGCSEIRSAVADLVAVASERLPAADTIEELLTLVFVARMLDEDK